eukprot:13117780-Ditylum_brightwellii.AAC.1
MTTPTEILFWTEGREMLINAYFNFQEDRNGNEDTKRSINIIILFNRPTTDCDIIRKSIQEDTRRRNPMAQAWLSCLQIVACPVNAGYLFYSVCSFEISPLIHQVIDIIYEETENHIKVSITNKPAFEDQQKRKDWYDLHGLKDQDHKEELNLRKVPTF